VNFKNQDADMQRIKITLPLAAIVCCLLICPATFSQREITSPQLTALGDEVKAGSKTALELFWQQLSKMGTPLIEPLKGDANHVLMTFLYRAKEETKNVVVFGGPAGNDVINNQMTHMPDTDLWYRTYRVRNDARFTYTFSVNDSLVPFDKVPPNEIMRRASTFKYDQLNPKRIVSFTPSLVELPQALAQPYSQEKAAVAKGKVEKQRFKSTLLNNERNIWIYTPAGYNATAKPYGLLVVFDGNTYLTAVPTQTILDNLLAQKLIPPMVAVIVDNVSQAGRGVELPCNPTFADFLAKELVPMIRKQFNISKRPAETVVAGSSYGGLASTYTAFRHPEVFGNVISQSGSYWWRPEGDREHEWLTNEFVKSPRLPIRFYMDVGLMETGSTPGSGPDMVVVNRHLRNVLRAKSYFVHYREFNGGHEYINWRGTLADGLLALAGKPAAK
jgi:enterochelin esterase-like enzyme